MTAVFAAGVAKVYGKSSEEVNGLAINATKTVVVAMESNRFVVGTLLHELYHYVELSVRLLTYIEIALLLDVANSVDYLADTFHRRETEWWQSPIERTARLFEAYAANRFFGQASKTRQAWEDFAADSEAMAVKFDLAERIMEKIWSGIVGRRQVFDCDGPRIAPASGESDFQSYLDEIARHYDNSKEFVLVCNKIHAEKFFNEGAS